ncbi:MAG: Chaperone protein TorD [Phycisphaerae bacterium]|nr:Chaperone protein TorD [Phycisphaerae bacterium]
MSDSTLTAPVNECDARTCELLGGLYALLSNAFTFPDAAWFVSFRRESCWEAVRVRAADADAALAAHVSEAERRLRRIRSARGDAGALSALQEDYARLFGHAVRGSCPPYELEYGRRDILQQSPQLADIGGFYAAFGLSLEDSARERLDHVSVECDFLARLCCLEAEAAVADDAERARVAADAHRAFLADHLGKWAPAFARQVSDADPDGFFGGAAKLLAAGIELDAARRELSLGPTYLPLCHEDPEATGEFECGVDGGDDGRERFVALGIDKKR